ncbi:MAG: hypothetical protein ACHQFZ_01115 [Acidimicrobiales bacterium]
MTDAVGPGSFDHPRERPAPSRATGRTLGGAPVELAFDRLTLVVAVKASCDGCRDFVHGPLEELAGVRVVVVSANDDGAPEWARAVREVLVAPELLAALDVRWPPFYVLVDPAGPRVVTEGVVFSPAQVAAEIARHLP